MAKIGRNDPCPCGSKKKYKKCCQGKGSSQPKKSVAAPAGNMSFQQAKHMAEQWLGQTALGKRTQKKVQLILDRYTLTEPAAVAKVKALGQESDGRVLFYEGRQWVAEADFSAPGQLLMTTATKKHGDRLRKTLEKIEGLTFQERTVDEFAGTEEGEISVGAEMLQFKKKFFKAWLDENNDRLSGKTPREAAEDEALRPELKKLLKELEEREKKRPKKERFRFESIKKTLGL